VVGKSVSHYQVIRPIGKGGMGVVYEAEDTRLGRRVAVKFLPPELSRDPMALERFQREARAASALNHPGICTVFAIEQHEGEHFIVMELLEGQALSARLAQRLDVDDVIDIGIQTADALESAHAKGIVHRDIKPANVFINARGQVKLLDFGLAKFETDRGTRPADETQVAENLTTPGTAMGTVAYMSPEQARGQLTDARTDLFSLGAVLYQMATGALPFPGETPAVSFEGILNRDPRPLTEINAAAPPELARIVEKALEKDRSLRYQSATDIKTDLQRLKRTIESGRARAATAGDSPGAGTKAAEASVAVLYFENLSGAKEDEYFRDGITEDIITELSKIKGMRVFSRPTVLAFRDRTVTPAHIGQQLSAAYVLTGSLRRAGNRLRINAQLLDTRTDFPLWSERYDREMQDVFELQDEIARKIAMALRITLTPQEQAALASKPTDNLQAYDLYLRARSHLRRVARQDLELAYQMLQQAVVLDPGFALAYAAMASVAAIHHTNYGRQTIWMERAEAAAEQASALRPDLPDADVARAWVLYTRKRHDEAVRVASQALARKPDCEGAPYLIGRALFTAGRYQELADMAESLIQSAGEDYNVYSPIQNALGAMGKRDAERNIRHRRTQALELHLKRVPEDVRARIALAIDYAILDRPEDALREVNLAMLLRPDEAAVLYNAACAYCRLGRKADALSALAKAHAAGFGDADWARRDPDLAILHGEPEFERLYPAG
jgi:non-specific serine/threonine protein kinase